LAVPVAVLVNVFDAVVALAVTVNVYGSVFAT